MAEPSTLLTGWLDGDSVDAAALDLCRIAKVLQVLAKTEHGGWRGWRRRRALVSILRRVGRDG